MSSASIASRDEAGGGACHDGSASGVGAKASSIAHGSSSVESSARSISANGRMKISNPTSLVFTSKSAGAVRWIDTRVISSPMPVENGDSTTSSTSPSSTVIGSLDPSAASDVTSTTTRSGSCSAKAVNTGCSTPTSVTTVTSLPLSTRTSVMT